MKNVVGTVTHKIDTFLVYLDREVETGDSQQISCLLRIQPERAAHYQYFRVRIIKI